MVLYERKLMGEIRKWVDKKSVVVVTGMRQVGKTTLLRMLFDEIHGNNKVFLDMENPLVQKIFDEADYDNIWMNLKPYGIAPAKKAYVFLDEIQVMPGVVKAVKYLFDHYDVQFFLTGSSSFYLKNLFPESLAGRKVLFELYPLDFEEFLAFKGMKKVFPPSFSGKEKEKNAISCERFSKVYEEFLEYGGFPKVVLAETVEEKRAVLEDIFKSYFEKDVRTLADFENIGKLRDFMILLMQRAGSKINISRISSEMGITRAMAYSYLSFLESTYFISLVKPFSRSVDREVSGARKVYICDTGMLNRFARISSGSTLENAIFNSIKKMGEVRYYQRRYGAELDFVLPEKGIALEVKESGTVYDMRTISKIAASLGMREHYVISKSFAKGEGFVCAADV